MQFPRRRFAAAALALASLLTGCVARGPGGRAHGPATPSVAADSGLAGTYHLQICAARCAPGDTAAAGFLGVLVLSAADLSAAGLTEAERREFRFAHFADEEPRARANLCFVLRDGPAISHSMASVHHVGRSLWSAGPADSIRFALYGSPDAAYIVTALPRAGGRLEGRGVSWGAGVVEHRFEEHVVATRVGPPRPALCLEAAREAARTAPERERVLRWRQALGYPPARAFTAAARALADLGFELADSSAVDGWLRTAPRAAVAAATGDSSPPRRVWEFPDSVAVELAVRGVAGGDSAQLALAVLSPLRAAGPVTDDVSLRRLWLAAALWVKIEERLAAPAAGPP